MEVPSYLPSNKDKLCRTCITVLDESPTSQNSLFFENKPTPLFTLFHDLITPEISLDDGLPNVLCKNCREQLQLFMRFKEQCLKANENLRKLFLIEGTSIESKTETETDYDYNNTLSQMHGSPRNDFVSFNEDKLEIKLEISSETLVESECDDDEEQPIILNKQKNMNQYQCNICNRIFENKVKFTIHFMQHAVLAGVSKEHFYFCKNCGELFKSQVELEEHFVKEHTNETGVLWKCSQCSETFDSENYLFKHETDEDHYNVLDKPSKDIFTCPMCSESYTTKSELISHSVVHLVQNYKCKICQKLFMTQDSYNWHANSHPSNGYFCDICNKHLANISSYKNHLVVVHQKTKKSFYSCGVCNRKFKKQHLLKFHERIHNVNKKFMCEYCGRQTTDLRDLRVHLRVHTAERPYKCTYANCSKTFKSCGQRSAHVRSHLNIRPHKCQLCGKTFTVPGKLKRHMLVHSNDRPFKCIVCTFTTKKKDHLSLHMKKHEQS